MKNLFSRLRGKGRPVIFLHGFPLHQGIWDNFTEKFINENTVVTVDLPGFGKSPILPPKFTLDKVAIEVIASIEVNKLSNAVLVGHSLGGYVALSMISIRPDLFDGLVLFHSTALPDSEERKEGRNKVIDFVEKNGALPFTTNFIAPLFADPQHGDIERVKQIAATTPSDTVIGYTKAMRDREDHVKTLRNFKKPTLFLIGAKDQGIPPDSIYEQAKDCEKAEIHVLQNVGHMGMFENAVEASTRIRDFLNKT